MTVTETSEQIKRLSDYRGLVDEDILDEIEVLADKLRGLKLVHINSTKLGGGVAELLYSLVPLFNDIGIETTWEVIEGTEDFFKVTKKFHNALQGAFEHVSDEEFQLYEEIVRENAKRLDLGADVVFLHDPQPLTLVEQRTENSKWIWRCHIDLTRKDPHSWLSIPEQGVWPRLSPFVEHYDAAIFSMPDFAQDLTVRQYIIAPSIDPLTDKNYPISDDEIDEIYHSLSLPTDRKIILQVSRFDRFKNPIGVIEAYKIFKAKHVINNNMPTCLILAGGGATDDPEGAQMKLEVEARAGGDPDIIILERPPTSHREINALQSGADIVIQNSSREGFGLVVTEALWKRRPVISTGVGGIKIQLLDGLTGLVAKTPNEMADRIEYLFRYPEISQYLGEAGHKHVKQHFLIPRQLRDYLRVIVDILKA